MLSKNITVTNIARIANLTKVHLYKEEGKEGSWEVRKFCKNHKSEKRPGNKYHKTSKNHRFNKTLGLKEERKALRSLEILQ